jgi:hypothetical protein
MIRQVFSCHSEVNPPYLAKMFSCRVAPRLGMSRTSHEFIKVNLGQQRMAYRVEEIVGLVHAGFFRICF